MATEAIHHPVENLELLRKLAEPLGYGALSTWFRELHPSLLISPNNASIPQSDTQPGYNVRHTSGYFRDCLTLAFTEAESPQDKITLRARKQYMGRGFSHQEVDLLGTSELAWKRGVGSSLDLIARGFQYKTTKNPSIVTVESGSPINPHDAEISLQKIALLIVDTPVDLKAA